MSCATETRALQLIAFARNPVAGAAAATVSTGDPNKPTLLVGVDTRYKDFVLSKNCGRFARRIPLSRRGLTSAGVVHEGDVRSPSVYCGATGHVLVRFQLGFDAAGKPVSATIAVRNRPRNGKSKAIGYMQWSPQRSTTYYSRACTPQG